MKMNSKMKTTSKWRRPKKEDDLKMKTTSKNKDVWGSHKIVCSPPKCHTAVVYSSLRYFLALAMLRTSSKKWQIVWPICILMKSNHMDSWPFSLYRDFEPCFYCTIIPSYSFCCFYSNKGYSFTLFYCHNPNSASTQPQLNWIEFDTKMGLHTDQPTSQTELPSQGASDEPLG